MFRNFFQNQKVDDDRPTNLEKINIKSIANELSQNPLTKDK